MLIKNIQERVCKEFNITKGEMISASRKRQYALPRHVAMYICYKKGHSTRKIAFYFKRKDHTTVLYAINKIKDLFYINEEIMKLCQECNEADISHYHHLKKFCTECQQDKNAKLSRERSRRLRKEKKNLK